jgi:hypothetical protein
MVRAGDHFFAMGVGKVGFWADSGELFFYFWGEGGCAREVWKLSQKSGGTMEPYGGAQMGG